MSSCCILTNCCLHWGVKAQRGSQRTSLLPAIAATAQAHGTVCRWLRLAAENPLSVAPLPLPVSKALRVCMQGMQHACQFGMNAADLATWRLQ
jgi:hypothetical protein